MPYFQRQFLIDGAKQSFFGSKKNARGYNPRAFALCGAAAYLPLLAILSKIKLQGVSALPVAVVEIVIPCVIAGVVGRACGIGVVNVGLNIKRHLLQRAKNRVRALD